MSSPDTEVRRLESLVKRDPSKVVKAAQARLDALQQSPHSPPDRIAAFYAVLAQAFTALELDSDARDAATAGLRLAPPIHDSLHLSLLISLSVNVYDSAGLQRAVADVQSAQRAVQRGSVADTCLMITLGGLQHRQDRDDLAILNLTRAYHASAAPDRDVQHVLAATALGNVVASMGDDKQALALNHEVIVWDLQHEAWLDLSVNRFLRGEIHRGRHDYAAALQEFAAARQLSVQLDDRQGIAFADLRMCQTRMEMGQWTPARRQCQSALEVFTSSQAVDMQKETRGLIARIDLAEGRAAQALAGLDSVLDHSGADMSPRRVATLYQLRAQTNAALKKYPAAYADLEEYVRRYGKVNDAERTKQSAAWRARFETDREIEHSLSLQRELTLGNERLQRQHEQLRWTIIAVAAGACVIALLTHILVSNTRHKRQLTRFATEDGLTGLLNRRRSVELASQALSSANLHGQPLTIAVIDLDHFKSINDRCGHAVGDQVLKEFARLGAESLRGADLFGRWGGEEFLVVLPDTKLDVALAIIERLRVLALEIRLPASGADLRVSFSAGLATNEPGVNTLDDVIARADAALYQAKERGRDLVHIATASYQIASTGVRRALHLAGATVGTAEFAQAPVLGKRP